MPKRREVKLARVDERRRGTEFLHGALRRIGYELNPYRTPGEKEAERELGEEDLRRAKLLEHRGINLLLDVGADGGQYGIKMRKSGYTGRIVSFEPRADAFAQLEASAADDANWECRRLALGSSQGSAEINVSRNAHSSSLLPMAERHRTVAPRSAYVGTEEVPVARLDSIWDELVRAGDRVYLKLDTQGFELEVLGGAERSLPDVQAVEAELSLVPLYEGAPVYVDLLDRLGQEGFRLAGLQPELGDPDTGELLQANGIFVRN
jgi:FkbM family methyltransferase